MKRKIISWNVNGFRAILNKGFEEFLFNANPDILCIQETKMQEGQAKYGNDEYIQYWNSAEKKGYSGTAIFTKVVPINVSYGIGIEEHDKEGRVITLEFDSYYLVNVYTPNSRREVERLDYRMKWEDDFKKYLECLNKIKPVVMCGDLNVAHKEIDLKNPKTNVGNAGFTYEEREKMDILLNENFIDAYRYINPDKEGVYTWWSYMAKARERNIGWRIDYFIVSKELKSNILNIEIKPDIYGSDHCPIEIELDI